MTELFIAFGAGLISFLSPCVLPLIPGYISYISGTTYNELLETNVKLSPLIFFTLGFSIIFILFGAGLISFLSPCVLPLIPGYISYISGQSLQEIFYLNFYIFYLLIYSSHLPEVYLTSLYSYFL